MTEMGKSQRSSHTTHLTESADGPSFRLGLTSHGLIEFQMRYRLGGLSESLDSGHFSRMTLNAARTEGVKPAVVRWPERWAADRAQTLEGLCRLWFESLHPRNFTPNNVVIADFEGFIFPKVGHLPPASLTAEHWIAVLALIDVDVTIRLGKAVCRMLTWARRRRLLPINVMDTPEADISFEQAVDVVGDLRTQERRCAVLEALERSDMTRTEKDLLKICVSLVAHGSAGIG